MVGQLRGTPTLLGLHMFAKEILPRLEALLGPEGFEVHVIGSYAPPVELQKAFSRPSICLRGYVESLDSEFASADVLLVPTPVAFSVRVRVLTGLSYGACVVAHSANANGIPEMQDGENVLLGRNGRELADAVVRAVRDPLLRSRIGTNGRRMFEKYFAPEVAGTRIAEDLAALASRQGEQG
jgi:glycosyltransferase involved in cell wall biosynthesis